MRAHHARVAEVRVQPVHDERVGRAPRDVGDAGTLVGRRRDVVRLHRHHARHIERILAARPVALLVGDDRQKSLVQGHSLRPKVEHCLFGRDLRVPEPKVFFSGRAVSGSELRKVGLLRGHNHGLELVEPAADAFAGAVVAKVHPATLLGGRVGEHLKALEVVERGVELCPMFRLHGDVLEAVPSEFRAVPRG